MIFEELQTNRLRLRKMTPDVMDYVFKNYTDEELIAFFGLNSPEFLAKEKEKYNKGLATYNRTFLYFQLLEKSTGKMLGWCGFHTWYPEHNRAEIFYMLLDDEHKKQGLMTEAIVPVLQYGFTTMSLHRVEAMTADYNHASMRLLEKMNFVAEGRLREHYYVDGKPEDSLMFSLLKSEFDG